VAHPPRFSEGGCEAQIWNKRFYDFPVWSRNKRIEKLRYIHRNPVRAGLVLEPEQWQWSSYRAYKFDERGPVLVNEKARPSAGERKEAGSHEDHPGQPRSKRDDFK
jgi:putative transposase